MQKPWTATAESTLTRMWEAGATGGEIAAALGVTAGAVTSKARRLALARRPSPIGGQTEQFAEALSEHGNIAEAGRAVGMGFARATETFDRICRKLGPQAA